MRLTLRSAVKRRFLGTIAFATTAFFGTLVIWRTFFFHEGINLTVTTSVVNVMKPQTVTSVDNSASPNSLKSSLRKLGSYLLPRTAANASVQHSVKETQHSTFPNSVRPTFEPSQPKYVVILTYQRCGSSFFGNIFNLNADAFYVYEPLDALYTALYGTSPGWNVPSDITNFPNGSARIVPKLEVDAVAEFLRQLLTGDVDRLPTEALVHKFWTQFASRHQETSAYGLCLREQGLVPVTCFERMRVYCGKRFGQQSEQRLEYCRRLLATEPRALRAVVGLGGDADARGLMRTFLAYRSCWESYRQRVDRYCTDKLRGTIVNRRLRAVKVVRATMESMRPLLLAMPNLRVIHLVRDPRAVARSRIRFGPSGRGLYTEGTAANSSKPGPSRVVAEASLYCRHATADIRSRLELERLFPGRILALTYDDVMRQPEQRFRDVYALLDEPAPQLTVDEMKKLAQKGQNASLTTKWQSSLTYAESSAIVNRCSEFFRLLDLSPHDV